MRRRKKAEDQPGPPTPPELATPSDVATPGTRPDPDRVAARAYELYLERGAADGRAMDDWLAAEQELARRRERG